MEPLDQGAVSALQRAILATTLAEDAVRIERAVEAILADGVLGGDLGGSASTQEVGDAIVRKIVTIS